MNDITIRPARRSNIKPLVGFYAESGGGKTFSALLLARGFIGPQGRIAMIETEAGRGEAYSDPNEYPELRGPDADRNYDVISLRDDFSPSCYGRAIEAAQKAGVQALIVDSGSHEWEGVGGVLDMAAKNQEGGKKGPLVWQKPKIDHQKHFMLRLMQTPVPLVILCMRAKYPMEEKEVIGQGGKKEKKWVRSEKLDPKQSEDVLFEMMVHGWFDQAHNFHPTKLTGRGLTDIFPAGQMITVETGRRFADWSSGRTLAAQMSNKAAGSTPAATSSGLTEQQLGEAKKVAKRGMEALEKWWKDLRAIEGEQTKFGASLPELKKIAEDADAAMGGGGGTGGDDDIPF